MSVTYVGGCDPGLVDTGFVRYRFEDVAREVTVRPRVFTRATATDISNSMATLMADGWPVFIEAYRPRGGMNTNQKMVVLVHEIAKDYGKDAKVLPNTGIKKVVKPALLALLESDGIHPKFVTTHHGDLVSAARIALLGMLKDPSLNALLARIVKAHLDGSPWSVRVV